MGVAAQVFWAAANLAEASDSPKACALKLFSLKEKRSETSIRFGLARKGPGFVLLKSSKAFSKKELKKLYDQLPSDRRDLDLLSDGILEGLSPANRNLIQRLRVFLQGVIGFINENLPGDETVQIRVAEMRKWVRGEAKKNTAAPAWHFDLDYLNITLSLMGEGTLYRDSQGEIRKAPPGAWLIFSGLNRQKRFAEVKPTSHASPSDQSKPRLVLIVSLDKRGH
jgi:hypothetical protein